eukprot:904875-Pelagomonas_calceolata.AAC.2
MARSNKQMLFATHLKQGAGPSQPKHAQLMWGSRAMAALVQSIGAAVGQKHAQEKLEGLCRPKEQRVLRKGSLTSMLARATSMLARASPNA